MVIQKNNNNNTIIKKHGSVSCQSELIRGISKMCVMGFGVEGVGWGWGAVDSHFQFSNL